jgi:hypothetical protein
MSMNIECRLDSGFLQAIATGEFSLEEAHRTFLELLEAVKQTHAKKVLFDGREVTGMPVVVERFYYGEFAAISVDEMVKNGWTPNTPQFAYVLLEPILDPLRLGETVAVNRGMNVKAFTNTKEAMQWLHYDSAF